MEDKEQQSRATCKLHQAGKCTKKGPGLPLMDDRLHQSMGDAAEMVSGQNEHAIKMCVCIYLYIECYVSWRIYMGVENPFSMTIIQAYIGKAMGNLLTVKGFKENSRNIFEPLSLFFKLYN